MTCPLCRTVADGCDPPLVQPDTCRTCIIPLPEGTHAGVTLSNKEPLPPNTQKVLTVVGLHPRDAAFSNGLRKGNSICSINGFHALQHEQAVQLINAATRRGETLVVSISDAAPATRGRGDRRAKVDPMAPGAALRPRARSLPASWGSALSVPGRSVIY